MPENCANSSGAQYKHSIRNNGGSEDVGYSGFLGPEGSRDIASYTCFFGLGQISKGFPRISGSSTSNATVLRIELHNQRCATRYAPDIPYASRERRREGKMREKQAQKQRHFLANSGTAHTTNLLYYHFIAKKRKSQFGS